MADQVALCRAAPYTAAAMGLACVLLQHSACLLASCMRPIASFDWIQLYVACEEPLCALQRHPRCRVLLLAASVRQITNANGCVLSAVQQFCSRA